MLGICSNTAEVYHLLNKGASMPTALGSFNQISADVRRHTAHQRRLNERILQLAEHLRTPDRLLLEQVYRHGLSAADVARLTGQPPRRVQRRLARLLQRMRDPLFKFVVARSELLPPPARAAARRVILQGQSLRSTAQSTGQSLHEVRQHINTVRNLARLI